MPDDHDQLRHAFAQLEEYAMPNATLAGLDHAHRTVRRRRTIRIAVGSAVAVVAIAAAATFALTRTGAAPDVVATRTPTAAPTGVLTTSPPAPSMTVLFDGPRPRSELDNARLDLPDFKQSYCPKGTTQFKDGEWSGQLLFHTFVPRATIAEVHTGDVNGDGTADLVALIKCSAGTDPGGVSQQVVAYTRDAASYRLLGRIDVAPGGTQYLYTCEITADGQVRVLRVTAPNVWPPTSAEWRAFRWDGSAFAAAGKAAAPLDLTPTRLSVAVQPLRISADGHGVLTVRVTNNGGPTLAAVTIRIGSGHPLSLTMAGTPLRRTDVKDGTYQWDFSIAAVPQGSTVLGTFEVTVPAKALIGPGQLTVWAQGVGVGQIPLDNADEANRAEATVSR